MKKVVGFLLLLVVLVVVNWHFFTNSRVPLDGGRIVIKQGENFATIQGKLLRDNQAYSSGFLYKIYVNLFGTSIKPGEKVFTSPPTFAELFSALDDNPQPIKVRLPEGATAKEFASILAEEGISTASSINTCFVSCQLERYKDFFSSRVGYEGFLFPDTYLFVPGTKPEALLDTILGNFSRRIEPLVIKYKSFLAQEGLRKVVTIASLLEREARGLAEKRMVAGVLYNRLQSGMRLDVDATILYIKQDWKATISAQDLLNNSPYNTRKYLGLPPGPICNPGLDSIEAAMSPTKSEYLYYLTGKNGEMHYAKTLEQHVQNKWNFL